MQERVSDLEASLAGLGWTEWLEKAGEIADEDGYAQPLGERHAAVFVEDKPTLFVSFENYENIPTHSNLAQPLGWQLVKALGWSHLCIVSNGDTWFRDRRVFGFFDRLIDDGFFEDFDQVIFYGAGPCGYAAAAYSVAAPGSKVLILSPQATLDPRITEWDERFLPMRRTAFDDRYGFAPDMLDAAEHAYVIYDPNEQLDAMHAALFTRKNVTKIRARFLGAELQSMLLQMKVLFRMLAQISAGKFHQRNISKLMRRKREVGQYQFSMLKKLQNRQRHGLIAILCREVLERRNSPPFRKALARANKQLANTENSQSI